MFKSKQLQFRFRTTLSLFVFLEFSLSSGNAQVIPVITKQNALVFQVVDDKDLKIIYLGKKLADRGEYAPVPDQYRQPMDYTGLYNSAFTPSGSCNLLEPAISVTHSDGNNSLYLAYLGHHFEELGNNVSLLTIALKDRVYPFDVTLYVKSYYSEDVIEQWVEIVHHEKKDVVLRKFTSANLSLQSDAFYLTSYHGDWAKEMKPEESKLTYGIKTLDTKLGTRANLFQPSVFMLLMGSSATEEEWEVLFGTLEWSGNFKIDFELDPRENLRLIAGVNNYSSEYPAIFK